MLRCAYVEVVLLDGGLADRAREACARAGIELVPVGGKRDTPAWIEDGTLHLDGEALPCGDDCAAVVRHLRARACPPGDAIGVGACLDLAPPVGTFWLAGAAPGQDPLLALELERHPNVRLAEAHGDGAFYEAVVTTLMERRS